MAVDYTAKSGSGRSYALWHGAMPLSRLAERVDKGGRALVHAVGVRVQDAAGRWYIDGRAGIANMCMGYGHPAVVEAIRRQVSDLAFAPTIRYTRPPAVVLQFASELAQAAPPGLEMVRFYNVGSLANEAAITMARLYQQRQGRANRTVVVSLDNSYHGSTLVTMAVSGQRDLHGILPGQPAPSPTIPAPTCVHCPMNKQYPECRLACARELEHVIMALQDSVAAVIVEPVMGNGAVVPPPGYLDTIADICRSHDVILIFDEIVAGFGRTGYMFAAQRFGVTPDIITLAKGITAGYVPMAAAIVSGRVYETLASDPQWFFANGFSTDGHAVAASAGLAVLRTLRDTPLLEQVRRLGDWALQKLKTELEREEGVVEVRGVGLLIGIEFCDVTTGLAAFNRMEEYGLLVHLIQNTILFTPPLVITEDELREAIEIIIRATRGRDLGVAAGG